ncbi:hypothetical protein G3I27_27175 [Streptomyces sp. SID10692]|nr:hypothetical protein [Streptomyces sp. SID10692]
MRSQGRTGSRPAGAQHRRRRRTGQGEGGPRARARRAAAAAGPARQQRRRRLQEGPLRVRRPPHPRTATPSTSCDPLGLAPDDSLRNKPVGRDLEGAKRDALRDAGIPEGTPPLEVRTHVPATTPEWQGGKQLMGEDHQPIYYREEVYEHPNGNDLIVYQDHWFGHQKPGEPGYQPAHVHVRPFENTRNGQVPGCEEHYYYDR